MMLLLTIEIIIFPIVVDRDIIAHRFPKEVVGCSTHQGSLGIDFRVRFGLFLILFLEQMLKCFCFNERTGVTCGSTPESICFH